MKLNIVSLYIIEIVLIVCAVIFLGTLRNTQIIDLSREVLLITLMVNLVMVTLLLRYLKFNLYSLILITFIILSFFIGVINNQFSIRIVLDIIKPIMFVFIYLIFSNLPPRYFLEIKEKLYKISDYFLATSFIGTIFMVFMISAFGGYPGIRLPLVLSINKDAIKNNNKKLILSIILVLISGKRAVLVGVIPVLFWKFKRLITFKNVFLVAIVCLLILINSERILSYDVFLFNKLNYTLRNLSVYFDSEDNLSALNKVTAQRLQEILSALYGFNFFDYFLGKGVGYTYDLYDVNREVLKKRGYGNNHFSPISLLVSYGMFFMILIYYKIIKLTRFAIKEGKKNSNYLLFLGFVLFSFLIESFFSFNIFANPFFPIILGLIEGRRKFIKNNEILLLN